MQRLIASSRQEEYLMIVSLLLFINIYKCNSTVFDQTFVLVHKGFLNTVFVSHVRQSVI